MNNYTNEELTENIIKMLKYKSNKDYNNEDAKRDAHSKCLGLLKAYFVVNRDLPRKYQIGVFKEPRTYCSFIRISNSNPKVKSDKSRDFRGLAIKLIGVVGKKCTDDEKYTQDFIFINNETMPIGTLEMFHDAIYHMVNSNILLFGIKSISKLPQLNIKDILKNTKNIASPLDIKYFSTTPYKFGDKNVKYCLVPKSIYKSKLSKKLTATYLSDNMQRHLNQYDAVFDFYVQFQSNEEDMPINDASIKWDSTKAPFVKLAKIIIPKQEFKTRERFGFAENMSFSPGHSLLEHEPTGDLNKARIEIYKEMSKFRHDKNNKKLFEPNEKLFFKF